MGRRLGPRSKISRRIGEKLHLKGDRDLSAKHAYTRRSYPPGKHGNKGYPRLTEYGTQLREKQKLKALFGLMERQFVRYVSRATKFKGETGSKLLELLERRLDNVVYRLHIAASRAQARQIVSHGHVLVNGRRVNIPSLEVITGMILSLSNRFIKSSYYQERIQATRTLKTAPPPWVSFDYEGGTGAIERKPLAEELEPGIETRLIVEYYSR